MIRYALRCQNGHDFDSWFQSADAFDKLAERGLVACAHCGSSDVTKALMAPKVRADRDRASAPAAEAPDGGPLTTPASEAEAKIAEMRAKLEAEATYVGGRFADEARTLHETGTEKAIWGEANAQEARKLLEDGVPVAPLPFLPKQKAN